MLQNDSGDLSQIDNLTYEQAFSELELVVASLEEGNASLENALALYERGQLLVRRCASLLDQAELKIQQLSGDTLKDYDPDG